MRIDGHRMSCPEEARPWNMDIKDSVSDVPGLGRPGQARPWTFRIMLKGKARSTGMKQAFK